MSDSSLALNDAFAPVYPRNWTLPSWSVTLLGALVLANALDFWAIGPIPLAWVSRLGALVSGIWLLWTGRIRIAPGTGYFMAFVIFGALLTSWHMVGDTYAVLMPPLASTPYHVYVLLRLLNLLSFAGMLQLVYTLAATGKSRQVIKTVAWIATAIALLSIYMYFAQVFGLPQPMSNRVATTGEVMQITEYTYAFHRAVGPFREPSHLAEWLAAPLFFSLATRSRGMIFCATIMLATLFLTGSLTGIVGTIAGLGMALAFTNPFGAEKLKLIGRLGALGVVALLVFNQVVKGYDVKSVSLIAVLSERITPIGEEGLSASDRDYVYQWVADARVPPVGPGFGNANLQFTHDIHADAPASFLSLYLYAAYSTGWIGAALLALFLIGPAARIWLNARRRLQDRSLYLLFAAYCAWLVMFAANSEEPSIMFAVVAGLLAFEVRTRAAAPPTEVEAVAEA
jgi:hypothetical protein